MILILASLILNFFIILNYKKISKIIGIYDYPDKKRKIHLKLNKLEEVTLGLTQELLKTFSMPLYLSQQLKKGKV